MLLDVDALHFENCCQIMVDSNCILLLLKTLNQDLPNLVNTAPLSSFKQPDTPNATDSFHFISVPDARVDRLSAVDWSILHATVNILRLLGKLTKGKNYRILVLKQLKSMVGLSVACLQSSGYFEEYFKAFASTYPPPRLQTHKMRLPIYGTQMETKLMAAKVDHSHLQAI